MKSKVTINVETYLLEQAKMNQINISKTTEDALRSTLNIMKGNATLADEMLIRNRLQRKEANLVKLQGEVTGLREQFRKIQEIKELKEEERLELEKKMIEATKRCFNCGNLLDEKKKAHKFPAGVVCNACFMTSTKEDISKWTKQSSQSGPA